MIVWTEMARHRMEKRQVGDSALLKSITSPEARAQNVLFMVEEAVHTFSSLPDEPGQRVHCLFAGLYRETTYQWLKALEGTEDPLFRYLVLRRFYDIYERAVPDYLTGELAHAPSPWRRYHWLAQRLTMRSPITLHLLLISFGVRAHVYHDLPEAICLAARDYQAIVGHAADFRGERPNVIGAISRKAFVSAALDYVALHYAREHGWRRFILGFYARLLRGLEPFWIHVMEGWRSHAWETAVNASTIR